MTCARVSWVPYKPVNGSGGGSSAGVPDQFEKKTWASIDAGETATVPIANGAIGVTEVSFVTAEKTSGAWIEVKREANVPAAAQSFGKKAYKYIEISKSPTLTEEQIKEANIKFKVEKSWLGTNGLSGPDVALFRYNNNQWVELPTTFNKDDGTYTYYSARSPGFSFFAIGGRPSVTSPASTSAESLVENTPEPSETPVMDVPVETVSATVPEAQGYTEEGKRLRGSV